jgi:Tol biopolymer transport system component
MRRRSTGLVASFAIGAIVAASTPANADLGDPPSGPSDSPALSADGRWLAFISSADNLLDGNPTNDTNGQPDAFLLDLQTGTISLVSDQQDGGAANGPTTEVDVSSDGRYVAFVSEATNLLPDDANGAASDVFVLDTQTGTLTLASRRGSAGNQGNGASWNVSISNDGSKVAFTSYAKNLVGGDTNNQPDAFVRDLVAASTTRVSTNSSGKQVRSATLKAAISGNGSTVAFQNSASGLVSGDTNGKRDVFVKVLATGKTLRVSLANSGAEANGDSSFYDLSQNGKVVVFTSDATNLVANDDNGYADTFIRDRTADSTLRVSRRGSTEANAASYGAAISPDGAYVAFTTTATNLGGGEPDGNGSAADVFEFEVATKALRRVAVDTTGGWADGANFDPTYGTSALIAFASFATDLAASDTNTASDVFTRAFGENRDNAGTTTHCSKPAPSS